MPDEVSKIIHNTNGSTAVPANISIEALDDLLKKHSIDPSKFTKTLNDLHVEIQCNDCFLHLIDNSELVRMVQPVFVKVMYKGRTLVNSKDVILSRNNQERPRNSLLSEKMFPNETPLIASKRALCEELLLKNDIVEKSVSHIDNLDRAQTTKMNSKSYEGLTSVYQKHLLVFEVMDGSPMMSLMGLPAYADFQTTESTPQKKVEHFWTWIDDKTARDTVVGANFDEPF